MTTEKTIQKVYRILQDVTPLRDDCGKLCGGECCKGDDDTGMLLFPGEEIFFLNNSDFRVKTDSNNRKILICKGKCDRKRRPVACRIFPLFPLLDDGRIYVIDDPRAAGICPLLYDKIRLNRKFERKVGKVGSILASNEETCEYLKLISDEIREIFSMTHDFLG